MINRLRVYWLTCVAMLLGAAASATTIILPTDAQLVAKTPLIVQGTVVSSQPVLRDDGRIWTETRLAVEQTFKGSASGIIVIREIGGEIDGRITKIFGAPEYAAGERVMAFLTPTPRGDYQTMDLFVGKFAEGRTMSGQRLWMRDDQADDVRLLDIDFKPIEARNVQRDAARFEAFVRDSVAGRKPTTANYGVENPVLENALPKLGGRKIEANFTLISEPTVYRWFVMDSGGSAKWYSFGTQAGYSGGGVNEIQTAMSSWNSYTSAKISYVYSGAGSGTPGGVDDNPNGVNEVLFNDVHGDIAGSFSGSGVVGLGGFNGTGGRQSWTSTFAADAQHPQGTFNAWNITEANLAIQDGVSPSSGISSTRLSEIVAHEFGHTLGFGHSPDNTALMYAYVTGLGPSLRPDDQLAARWLYPSGSSGGGGNPPPTAPAAPSNVHASYIGGSSISVTWIDNSSNESGFRAYLALAGASFTRVGSTAANATSATISGLTSGNYQVYIASYNSAGETASNTAAVTVPQSSQPQPPSASFSVSPTSGTAGSTVFSFNDSSTGSITSWLWQFGDNTSSAQQSPTHVYANAGSYTVQLTVSGAGTTSSTNRVVTVTAPIPVTPPASAAFGFGPSSPKAGETVSFTDQSSGSPTQWMWYFGDNATSTASNPSHAYASAGTYTVTLQVWNSSTTSTTSRTITIAPFSSFRSLVSAAAQIGGVSSTWRTELTLFNASSNSAASGQFLFIPGAGGAVVTQPLYLAPLQSVTYSNALPDIFGIGSGAGAIAIEATSPLGTPDIKITSRTFTTGSLGTYGQAVPQIATDDLAQTLYVTGIESDADYRTNIGLVNRSGAAVPMTLSLFASDGSLIASANVTLPASNFQQNSLAYYFPALGSQPRDGMTLRALAASSGAVSVYASVVNNKTQDPVYIQGIATSTSSRALVPAVGRAPGIGGTYWRSDVTLMNPNLYAVRVGWRYLPAGSNNTSTGWSYLNLSGGETRVLRDVASMFGVASGTGALEFAADGFVAPVITSRTYTTTEDGGTYGQSIDPVAGYRADVYVPGLRADASYRSNVGFYNNSDAQTVVTAKLVNLNGQTVAQTTVTVPAHAPVQYSLGALFPSANLAPYATLTLHAHTDGGAILFGYASVVDNASGDPVFFAAQ